MAEIDAIFNEQTVALIATLVISLLGGYVTKVKSKLGAISNFTVVLNDAIYDNKITEDEVKALSDELRKLANK